MEYTMMELLPVVKYLSDRYTSKESGSVTYDMASQLMEAVIYCIREYENADGPAFAEQETGSAALYDSSSKQDARQAYDAGYQLVLEKTTQAKAIYDKTVKKFHAYGCTAYFDTVIKGMPSFFLYYDARFNPQNHILTLDYPVLISQENLCGIDRIMAYLNCIRAEQEFLGKFPETLVRQVLSARQPDYRDLFENLAEMMLRYCLGCMMTGNSLNTGGFEPSDYETIRHLVNHVPDRQTLEEKLLELLQTLIKQGWQGNSRLAGYLSSGVPGFAVMLMHGAEHDCMEAVL